MFRSREIQFLKDQLARERSERLDLLSQLAVVRQAHSEEIKALQSKLVELVESIMRPRVMVPTSATTQYPAPVPRFPGFRPETTPEGPATGLAGMLKSKVSTTDGAA